MIQIRKPSNPPSVFAKAGAKKTQEDCDAYDSDPDSYNAGEKKFKKAKQSIYKSVKKSLLTIQHGKCCYCETKFLASSHGDVEHYRPKRRAEEDAQHPGYYWLAYDWDNLFLSCEQCNRTHKRAKFPIARTSQRACNHHDDIDSEEPLLVHPSKDNPREHIRFKLWAPDAITEIGQTTIKCLALRRPALEEARMEEIKKLKLSRDIVNKFGKETAPDLQKLVSEARETIDSATLPKAKYSSMAQDLLACTE